MASTVRDPRAPQRRIAPLTPASFHLRVLGALIDYVLILVVAGLVSAALLRTGQGTTQIRIDAITGETTTIAGFTTPMWVAPMLVTVFTAAYLVPSMALWGRTVGSWCVGIRCVRTDSGGRPGWAVSGRRWLLLYGIAAVASFLPYVGPVAWLITLVIGLSPLWDRSGRLRGYADRFAGDLVVNAGRSPAGR